MKTTYTIEWTTKVPLADFGYALHKHITAYDNYLQARAMAIKLLKERTYDRTPNKFEEYHDVCPNGMICDRLRAKVGRLWYQITIKYHQGNIEPAPLWE